MESSSNLRHSRLKDQLSLGSITNFILHMSLKFVAGVASVAYATVVQPEPEYVSVTTVRVEVPSIPYCPDGSVYDASLGCSHIDYAEPQGECPHPYKLDKSSGACVTVTVGSSTLVCGAGSYLDGNNCITDITTPIEISCTKGEISKSGCVVYSEPVIVDDQYSDVKYSCSKGYTVNGSICVKESTTGGELACADGTLSGSKCITYTSTGKVCTNDDYTLVGDQCLKVTVASPNYKCPKGSSADSTGACLTEVTATPSQVCEKGYEYNSKKNNCEAQVLITAVLSSGSTKTSTVAVDCKLGTIGTDGNCYQTYSSNSVSVCDKDFDLVGKNCVTHVEVSSVASCSLGYVLNTAGTECVYTSTISAKCPSGYTASDEKGVCLQKISESAAIVCPKGYSLNDKSKCSVMEAVDATVSCQKGYDLVNGQCVIPGYVDAGEDKYYDFNYSCPKGYSLDKDELICHDQISASATVTCDKGFTLNGKKCTASFSTAAQLMCPKNYSFDSSKDGSLCQRVSYSRPVFKCPDDSTTSGSKCYTYADTDASIQTTSAPINKKGDVGNLRRI